MSENHECFKYVWILLNKQASEYNMKGTSIWHLWAWVFLKIGSFVKIGFLLWKLRYFHFYFRIQLKMRANWKNICRQMKSIPQTKECVNSVSIVLLTSSGKLTNLEQFQNPNVKWKNLHPKHFLIFSQKKNYYILGRVLTKCQIKKILYALIL